MIALFFLACLVSVLCHISITFAQEGKLERAIVSYAGMSGLRGPLWIAKETGLFEKYGLDVRLVQITAGTTSINALIAGDVDMAITTSSAAIAAALRGSDGSRGRRDSHIHITGDQSIDRSGPRSDLSAPIKREGRREQP